MICQSFEYETIGLMGSNLDVDDLDEIARMNYYCDDIGIDTMDAGVDLETLEKHGNSKGTVMPSCLILTGDHRYLVIKLFYT